MRISRLAAAAGLLASMCASAWSASAIRPALDIDYIGLLPANQFRLADGACADCPTLKQGLWYFKNEVLAVPGPTSMVSGFEPGPDIIGSVQQWAQDGATERLAFPGLVWLGAPQLLDDAWLMPDGRELHLPGGLRAQFKLVPKIPTNLSFWNEATTRYFAARPIRIRGAEQDAGGQASFVVPPNTARRGYLSASRA